MDKIILNAEKTMLTGEDVHQMTKGEVNILPYHTLANAASLDDILGSSGAAILLYEMHSGEGHWTMISKKAETLSEPEHIEFFDPLGLDIDSELPRIPQHVRASLNEDVPHLTRLVRATGLPLVWNRMKLQRDIRDVNTCGRHCVVRWLFRKSSLHSYQAILTRNRAYNPDFWVSALTLLHSMLS
jgi:hypothetical protein